MVTTFAKGKGSSSNCEDGTTVMSSTCMSSDDWELVAGVFMNVLIRNDEEEVTEREFEI